MAITGRSMENAMKVSTELGYMDVPEGVLMDLTHIKSLPKNKGVHHHHREPGRGYVRPDPHGLLHPPAGGNSGG